MIDYGNDKLNEIFNDTWPNLGWAKRMDEKPKFAGDYKGPLYAPHPDIKKMTHEEMLEEAERREKENQVLQIAKDAMEKYDGAFKELSRIERADRILERYNHFYNLECSGLAHGTPITPEFQQAMTLECMLDALRCENLNHEFDSIPTDDINDLINNLYDQGKESLKKWEEFKDSADGVA